MLASILRQIEEEDRKEKHWIVGPETGRMLHWLVRVVQPEVAVEIGTSVGYSALWIADALRANGGGRLWTVESHDERFKKAQDNIERAGMSEWVVQQKGHAPEIFKEGTWMPESIDFAFFDATKKNHMDFFEEVYPRMNQNGMIVVDNVQSHRFGEMEKFIKETYAHTGLKVTEIDVGSGLLIARVLN